MIDGKDYLVRLNEGEIIASCIWCGVKRALKFTREQEDAWTGGALIQRITSGWDDDSRELMISGQCGPCFDRIFEDEE